MLEIEMCLKENVFYLEHLIVTSNKINHCEIVLSACGCYQTLIKPVLWTRSVNSIEVAFRWSALPATVKCFTFLTVEHIHCMDFILEK